jgi:acyl CoA:acetate/3-ketoacid CoA transferase alpha subunit
MKQKIYSDIDAAIADVPDGARMMFGGFGGAGFPNNLIQALARKGTKDIFAIRKIFSRSATTAARATVNSAFSSNSIASATSSHLSPARTPTISRSALPQKK